MKPKKLEQGDTVALVTLSWGGGHACRERYEVGKKQLEETFHVRAIETPNALQPADWIQEHPEERLADLLWAFKNPDIKAIISIIGGDDCIRLLDFLTEEHLTIIRENPKIFVGFSDTTFINLFCHKVGLTSFYGPTVLFGFAENGGIDPYTEEYVRKALFGSEPMGIIGSAPRGWTLDRVPWTKEGQQIKRKFQQPVNMRFIQGQGSVEGKLMGGCIDVLELAKGTILWPDVHLWEGSILCIETSEEKPSPEQFKEWLRDYGTRGILHKIHGIMFGIPGGDIVFDDPAYDEKLAAHLETFAAYDQALLDVAKEFEREDLPIVTHVHFGHTMPMVTLPFGVTAKLNADAHTIEVVEVATQ